MGEKKGLYRKYQVYREGKIADGEFFVLKLDSRHTRERMAVKIAMTAYRNAIESYNPELAKDLSQLGYGSAPEPEKETLL